MRPGTLPDEPPDDPFEGMTKDEMELAIQRKLEQDEEERLAAIEDMEAVI